MSENQDLRATELARERGELQEEIRRLENEARSISDKSEAKSIREKLDRATKRKSEIDDEITSLIES